MEKEALRLMRAEDACEGREREARRTDGAPPANVPGRRRKRERSDAPLVFLFIVGERVDPHGSPCLLSGGWVLRPIPCVGGPLPSWVAARTGGRGRRRRRVLKENTPVIRDGVVFVSSSESRHPGAELTVALGAPRPSGFQPLTAGNGCGSEAVTAWCSMCTTRRPHLPRARDHEGDGQDEEAREEPRHRARLHRRRGGAPRRRGAPSQWTTRPTTHAADKPNQTTGERNHALLSHRLRCRAARIRGFKLQTVYKPYDTSKRTMKMEEWDQISYPVSVDFYCV